MNSGNNSRPVTQVVTATRTLEGAGFPVRRPVPTADLIQVDPFLLLDHLGPVNWGPGEAVGAPDHPHRGFETVTYLLEGSMQHKDSHGHAADLNPGDAQWMTAGAGVVHSEMPHASLLEQGGVLHGFQIWVNLPARDKMITPRYQDVPSEQIPQGQSEDGKVRVKVIAGESLGVSAVIDTHTPISYLHFSIEPGGKVVQPQSPEQNVMAYVFSGSLEAGPESVRVSEGQLAIFAEGEDVLLEVAADAEQGAEVLLLAGTPINEPMARYGPFVMNTQQEILQAIQDYRSGAMGEIAASYQ